MSAALDIRSFTVGPVQENAYIVRPAGSAQALLIDPGEEPDRLRRAIDELGVNVQAILITHCHFDHIGAVAPLARASGAPSTAPRSNAPCWRTSCASCPTRASAPTRATRPITRSPAAST